MEERGGSSHGCAFVFCLSWLCLTCERCAELLYCPESTALKSSCLGLRSAQLPSQYIDEFERATGFRSGGIECVATDFRLHLKI